MAPFKSVINDMYSRDNSKKIKMALRTKQEDGKWVGGCPPFGYMKDENDKNHLIVNNEEVEIVRKIFSLFLKGHSINYIANYLSKQNIPTPSIIRGKKSKYASFGIWSPITIKNILTNELYTGNMVQNRRKKVNYKIKKIIKNDRSSWIVVNNTHEAIISEKEFDLVNKLLKANNKLLHHDKRLGKYEYFVCNTYRKYSRLGLCTNHSISNDKLEYEILSILKKLTNMEIITDRSLIIKLINKIVVHEDKEVDVYFNFKSPVLSPSM